MAEELENIIPNTPFNPTSWVGNCNFKHTISTHLFKSYVQSKRSDNYKFKHPVAPLRNMPTFWYYREMTPL